LKLSKDRSHTPSAIGGMQSNLGGATDYMNNFNSHNSKGGDY